MQNNTHARSCVNCYQRKLKCDREYPCARCTDRGVQCTYPQNKITRTRPKKSTSSSLHEKVARLEKEVIGIKDAQSNGVTIYSVNTDSLRPGASLYVMDDAGEKKLLSRIGRVKIEDEDEQHVKASMRNTYAESLEEDKPAVPFMLPMFSSMAGGPSNEALFLPTVEDFEHFYTLFCERVDPIVRILHKPTLRRLLNRIRATSSFPQKTASDSATFSAVQLFMPEKWQQPLPKTTLGQVSDDVCSPVEYALLMTIAYSATCSMLADDARLVDWFGETLSGLRKKLSFATEVAMSRLKLYSTKDFTALQVFTLYITTKILDDNSPDIWHTLWCPVALAVSIAYSMNVHKDGYTIGLTPFDTELRRRLWWHLVMLQVRTSENYSCDLLSPDGRAVQLPANIDDDEMSESTACPLVGHSGPTEMTASLLRYEAIVMVAEATQDGLTVSGDDHGKEAFAVKIQKFEERLNTKYLAYARAHPEDERSKLIIALGTIAVLKMCWVWGFRLMSSRGEKPQLTPGLSHLSDELFMTATKMLEQQVKLNTEPKLKNLYWILRNIKPWDGAAIILAQMKVRLQNDYAGVHFGALPDMLKEAWRVASTALDATNRWGVDHKLVESSIKMRAQIAVMVGLPVDNVGRLHDKVGEDDEALSPLPSLEDVDMTFNDESLKPDSLGKILDPWPMFIPMNFSAFGGGF